MAFSAPITSPKYHQVLPITDSTPVAISFPEQKITVPVESALIENGRWPLSGTNAIYLSNSAQPGEQGRTIIYGHATKPIFGNLYSLAIGDPILISAKNNTVYTYKITSKQNVYPTDVSVLAPTNQQILTVYTCTGPLDIQRLVVNASYQGSIL